MWTLDIDQKRQSLALLRDKIDYLERTLVRAQGIAHEIEEDLFDEWELTKMGGRHAMSLNG